MGWLGNSPLFSEATCFLVQNPPIYHSIYKCFFNFDPYIQLQKKSNFMFTEADINKEQDRTDSRRIQCEKVLLEYPHKDPGVYTFYCPCYMRVKVKNFLSINREELYALFNGKILFDLNLTKIPKEIRNYIKHNIFLEFHRDFLLKLDEEDQEINIEEKKLADQKSIF